MSNYPNSIYSGRVMTNRDGVSFDSAKTKVIFAEDFNDKKVEITAIENELGVNAKGSYANVKAWLTALSSSISLLAPYPVGSIYISVASTSPATLFGGTWVAFGAGRVLVGINSGDADFDTVEETRGEKTHTLTAAEQASMPVKLYLFRLFLLLLSINFMVNPAFK